MRVEIAVLSGADVGRRLAFDAPCIRVGDTPDCDVYFDPHRDPQAAGCRAELAVTAEGWRNRNAGRAGLMVNQQLITGPTRLKSGDVVRMSDRGPDFSFTILVGTAATATLQPAPSGPVAQVEPGEHRAPPRPHSLFRWVAVGAAAAAVLLVILMVSGRHPGEPTGDSLPSPPVLAAKPVDVAPVASPAPERSPAPASAPQPAPPKEPNAPTKQTESVALKPERAVPEPDARLLGAVCLVLVEDPKAEVAWPFATATAIGKTTLLTSASAAMELDQFRSKGWNVKAAAQGRGTRIQVREILVHAAYPALKSEPEKRAHVDLALLKLAADVPNPAPLATADDLQAVEPGTHVICLGIPHEAEAVNRFQGFKPLPFEVKVFLVTALPSSAVVQRLLHFQGAIPPHLFGAPIVNREGRVLGVYAGVSAVGNAPRESMPAKGFAVHLAPLIDPKAVRSGIDASSPTWISLTQSTDRPASP